MNEVNIASKVRIGNYYNCSTSFRFHISFWWPEAYCSLLGLLANCIFLTRSFQQKNIM